MTTVSNERGYRCLFLDWCFGNVWPPKILFLSMPNVCWHSEIWAKVCKNGHFDPEFFLYHITSFRSLLIFKIMSVQRLRNVRTETVRKQKWFFFDVLFTKECLECVDYIWAYLRKSNRGLGLVSGVYGNFLV